MAHVLLIGDEAQCAPIRAQLVRWGLTVASPAGGAPTPDSVGVDACDVVLVVGSAAGIPGPDAVSDGGRGAAPAAPRLFLPTADFAVDGESSLWPRIQEACRLARGLRGLRLPDGADLGDMEPCEDVHQVGHELRSPLTAIKTALELMQGDLRSWQAEPADVEAQLRMLEIALRNVRRLHRAVEWSQMMLSGPRGEGDAITAAAGAEILALAAREPETGLHACESSAG